MSQPIDANCADLFTNQKVEVSIAVLGFGSSITFQSGFCANVTDISFSGISRESVEVTNFASTNGWKEYMPSLMQDMGELEVELIHDPDTHPPYRDGSNDSIAAETVTVTFQPKSGQTSGATIACSGFMTSYDISVPGEDKVTATTTLKFTGEPTFTDGS